VSNVAGSVLVIGGTQVTTSDLHLLYHRAYLRLGWRSEFLSNDSHLPFGEKILQQSRLRFSAVHFGLFNARVRRAARQCRPNLVFITGSNWYLWPETIRHLQRRYGARVVLNEQHLQVFRPYQAACLAEYDHVFVQDSGLVAVLTHASPARGASLLGPACDPLEHRPLALDDAARAAYGSDVSYLGHAYGNRLALFEELTAFRIRLWGVGWERSELLRPYFDPTPVHGIRKTRIYNATRINVNLQSVSYQLDGVTCRPFEVAACGGFCLCEDRRDLGRFLKIGSEVATFSSAAQLKDKIAYYLAHPNEVAGLAAAARARVLAEHTYEHRVRQVLDTTGLG
jgi:spore maturation protein CgeB